MNEPHTSGIALETFGEIFSAISRIFRTRPDIAEKTGRYNFSETLMGYLEALRSNMKQYYGSRQWLAQRHVREGEINAKDFAMDFCIGEHFPRHLLQSVRSDVKEISKLIDNYHALASEYMTELDGLYEANKHLSAEALLHVFQKEAPKIPTPMEQLHLNLTRISGNFEVVKKKRYGSLKWDYYFERKPVRNPPALLPALTAEQIVATAGVVMEIASALEVAYQDNKDMWAINFTKLKDHYQTEGLENVLEFNVDFLNDFSGEGLWYREEMTGIERLMQHMVDLAHGLEKYMRRSLA